MISLRDEIYNRLAPLTIQINSETHYREYENICQLTGKAYSELRYFNKNSALQYFYAERELIGKIEHLESTQPDHIEILIEKTNQYFKELTTYRFTDEQVRKAGEASWAGILTRVPAALLSLPLFIFGCVFNVLPFFIPRMIIPSRVKDAAFLSTFQFVTGLIVFPLFYLFSASLLFILTGSSAISVFTLVLMPFTGKIAFQFFAFYRDILLDLKFKLGNSSTKNNIYRLLNQREKLIKSVLEEVNY